MIFLLEKLSFNPIARLHSQRVFEEGIQWVWSVWFFTHYWRPKRNVTCQDLLEGRGLGHVGTFDQGIPCKATEYQAPWSWLNLTKPSQSSRDFPRIGGTVCSKPSNFWCSEALFWGPKNWGHPIYGQPSGQTIFSTNPLPACRFRGALEAQWSERWEMGLGAAAAWRRQVAKMVINCLHCRRHHQQKQRQYQHHQHQQQQQQNHNLNV